MRSVFTGFELSFYSGVYSTCIGFTRQLGEDAKMLVGLSGIFIGFGEVLGRYILQIAELVTINARYCSMRHDIADSVTVWVRYSYALNLKCKVT